MIIREWDDLAAQYGMSNVGTIRCPGLTFVPRMRNLCGDVVTVVEYQNHAGYECLIFEESESRYGEMRYKGYFITDHMVRMYEKEGRVEEVGLAEFENLISKPKQA